MVAKINISTRRDLIRWNVETRKEGEHRGPWQEATDQFSGTEMATAKAQTSRSDKIKQV